MRKLSRKLREKSVRDQIVVEAMSAAANLAVLADVHEADFVKMCRDHYADAFKFVNGLA